jgi:hypothetical protein
VSYFAQEPEIKVRGEQIKGVSSLIRSTLMFDRKNHTYKKTCRSRRSRNVRRASSDKPFIKDAIHMDLSSRQPKVLTDPVTRHVQLVDCCKTAKQPLGLPQGPTGSIEWQAYMLADDGI